MPGPPRPPIPLQMAGGRAHPARLRPSRRPVTPSPPSAVASPALAAAAAFEFTFESGVTHGTTAPPGTPVGSVRAGVDNREAEVPARPLPEPPRGLYGRPQAGGAGGAHYEPTARMDDWIDRLQALSLQRQQEEEDEEEQEVADGSAAAAVQNGGSPTSESAASNGSENARAGDKRSSPAPKRSRVGSIFNRNRAKATTASSSVAVTSNMSTPADAPSAISRVFCHAGSAVAATIGSGTSAPIIPRTIKVCLVGDVGAGKTAFSNRLINNSFTPTSPSLVPDFQTVTVQAEDGSIVNVELWDFPGTVAGERSGPLLSTFFHAAIICFGLEDKENLNALSQVWNPKLEASLHDRALFVLGLKCDLRPSFPTLNLPFLPAKEPVTQAQGVEAARAIQANGYGEPSRSGREHEGLDSDESDPPPTQCL
ncbi:P-loop containing nucleoside triphosphate hydrolase protein [Achaetomium macrosporum]|uniref:P-loop containing nucleoside triphosphate hydrolase protein n=1 Tax=Achaetomium macrosporum TaxID=79813 RepID=A0AAN7CHJ0_9PEZI|nr:P-loop containing nucleoside triphosphate hydrolase protein [Achaetomium macrosporum]